MDKKTFICNYFIHADGNDMESMRSAAEQRAKVLEEIGAFVDYAPRGTAPAQSGGATEKKPYSGEMKDPEGAPSEKQISMLNRFFTSAETKQIFEHDEYILKNKKMSPEVLGKFVDGRYVGKYTKKNASAVVSYVLEKADFHKKIHALMKTLGKTDAEVQGELDKFSKTSDKKVWAEVMSAIESKESTPAEVVGEDDF